MKPSAMLCMSIGLGTGLFACNPPPEPTTETSPAPCEGADCPDVACLGVTDRLDFGEVPLADGPVQAELTLSSDCAGPLRIDEVRLTSPPGDRAFALVGAPTDALTLDGGETLTLTVVAQPQDYGEFGDTIEVLTNAEDPTARIALAAAAVCESLALDVDRDRDGIPDGCDRCLDGDDRLDTDGDDVPDACDACEGFDDGLDADRDGVADGCDVCAGSDDARDDDLDLVPNGCDRCPGSDDRLDIDRDAVPDGCDVCPGFDDLVDTDGDGFADGCDRCALGSDTLDDDGDTIPDACDVCASGDDRIDVDLDDVPDACDTCLGADDRLDADLDGVPDGCDVCANFDDSIDSDGDTVPDGCDVCAGFVDALDADGDSVPDGCDVCPGFVDALDADADSVPDGCDICPLGDDALDADDDTVPDACDACAGFDDLADIDFDTVPDACDVCTSFDDLADSDGDTVPDGCDRCEGFDDAIDADGDGVPGAVDSLGQPLVGSCDRCEGFDDAVDEDFDGRPDRQPDCDPCVGLDQIDAFPPTPASQVDVLFVIDDTASATDLQMAFGAIGSAFVNALAGIGADWQVEVVPFGGPNYVEKGIDRAYDATLPGGVAGPGSPFLRSGANLSIVFLADQPDQSTITPEQAHNHWVALKGGDPDKVVVSGFVPAPPNGGYDTLIGLTTGLQFDVATAQWGPDAASIAVASIPALRYPLSGIPVPETLLVRADGVPYPDFLFDRSTNEIVFDNAPAAGSFVTVEYVEDCEGGFEGCLDGVDNDNDGLVDYPDDPGCLTPYDPNETDPVVPPTCANGSDDDLDGPIDFPADAQCASAAHPYESCTEVDSDVYGYRICEDHGAAAACPDLTASPALALTGEGTALVPLGFTFELYGTPHTEVYVGANGTLNFDLPLSPPNGTCLPGSFFGQTIAVWWDDLDPGAAGVWARTGGAAPNRQFEVQWRASHASGGGPIDVRAVLHEGSGEITLCYVDTTTGTARDDGAFATAGLQVSGDVALEYSCQTDSLTENKVVRFLRP